MTEITNVIPPELAAWLAETASSLAIVAVVVFAGFILWGAFQGFRRSIFRQVIHLAVTVAIAVVAFLSTSSACEGILEGFREMSMAEFVAMLEVELAAEGVALPAEVLSILPAFDMEVVGYAISLVFNTLAAPFVFAILFGIIGVVGKVVTSILCFFVPKGQTLTFKLLGVLGGIVEGAVIAGVVLLPFIGIVNIAGDTVDVVRENDPENEIVEFYDEIVAPLEEHAIFKTVGGFGGYDMLDKLAIVEIDGNNVDLRDELVLVAKVGMGVSEVTKLDIKELSPEEKALISYVVGSVDDSEILKKISCGALNGLSNAISAGALDLGLDEGTSTLLNEVVGVLGKDKTNPDTLGENLETLTNVFFILAENGAFNREEGEELDIVSVLTVADENGETVLTKVINELDKNDNTRYLIPTLSKYAISTMIPEGSEEVYDEVKTTFSEIVKIETEGKTDEEIKDEVSVQVENVLDSFDITVGEEGSAVTEETVEEIKNAIVEELKKEDSVLNNIPVDENGQISDADLLNLLLQYAGMFGFGGESEGQGE